MSVETTVSVRRRGLQNLFQPETDGQKQLKQSQPEADTISWHDLEEWQKDNEYIVNGYRRVQYHWKGCLKSVYSYLNNETVNIHSHLWGGVFFLYFAATFHGSYITPFASVTSWRDQAVFFIFFLSAAFCMFASALYHTSGCHSKKVAARCHVYDYQGIVTLTVGSFYPVIYYSFFCHPLLQVIYLTGISLAGLGAAYIVLSPEYAKPTHRKARTAVFIGLGLGGVVPITHLFFLHEAHEILEHMGIGWLIISALLYIGGALLYANRIPERLAPGKFDYFFASHQIFHFCVILAALAHYQCILVGLVYRISVPDICQL